jgi:Cyclic nucleotide-binding domain
VSLIESRWDEADDDTTPRDPGLRSRLLATKIALWWAGSFGGRTLEIQFGLSRTRAPGDAAELPDRPGLSYAQTGSLVGQAQPMPSAGAALAGPRTPDPGPAETITAGPSTPSVTGLGPVFPLSSRTHKGTTVVSNNFWDCLNDHQKRLFRAKAQNRVFAAGARLMREGEEANHVAVILSGLTEIWVCEHGVEQVVAERGPGQLIGERAALEVNVRSATVVAVQTVAALVMRTADFAAFISTYPAVLKIVEEQIYLRLREGPASARYDRGEPDDGRPASPTGNTAAGAGNGAAERFATGARASRPLALTGQNCTVVRTDVVRYNSDGRDGEAQKVIRRETLAMTRLALGPVWDVCRWEDRGDGLLVIVAPDVPTAQILERLAATLPSCLKRHNRTFSDSCRIQLRVAAEVGPIEEDESGVCGRSINHVSRLVEAPAFKRAIDDRGTLLGLIVSPYVYQAHVRPGGSFLDPAEFTEVPVKVKETDTIGWMWLTGRSGSGLGGGPGPVGYFGGVFALGAGVGAGGDALVGHELADVAGRGG